MAEEQNDGLFREIDEELRQEKAASLAKQYGKYVIAAAIILVGGVGGYKAWQSHELDSRMSATDAYVGAVNADDGGLATLDAVAGSDVGEIGNIASMRRAGELAKDGDFEGAIAVYRGITGNTSVDADTRAVASMNLASLLLDQGDAASAKTTIEPLTVAGSGWQYAALEISALASLDSGDIVAARESLEKIVSSDTAPTDLKTRASTLLDTLPRGENG